MARTLDPVLKELFTELHGKMTDTAQKTKFLDVKIESLKRTKQRADLTIRAIDTMEPNTRTYASVGRMFLLDDMQNIKSELEAQMKSVDENIKSLDNNKIYLQRNLKEADDSVRELVKQRLRTQRTTSG